MATELSIAPGLLIAMPQLDDPNFHRSVVLMIDHGPTGSWGVIVNRPSEEPLVPALESGGLAWAGDEDDVLWDGGPVVRDAIILLHEPNERLPTEGGMTVTDGIALSSTRDALEALADANPRYTRVLRGHAGWGADQLESELAGGFWLNADATPELVFETSPEKMWSRALEQLGVSLDTLVPGAGVH